MGDSVPFADDIRRQARRDGATGWYQGRLVRFLQLTRNDF